MPLVVLAHDRQISRAEWLGQLVHRPTANAQQHGLARDTKFVCTVDYGFALSNSASLSAFSQESFSRASWQILACSGVRLTGSGRAPMSKTSAVRSSSCRFHSVIRLGCNLIFSHSAAMVRSLRSAAGAICALITAVCARRLRRPDGFFFIGYFQLPHRYRPDSNPRVSTYAAVQICVVTSRSGREVKGR